MQPLISETLFRARCVVKLMGSQILCIGFCNRQPAASRPLGIQEPSAGDRFAV